jgi:DNA-binding GntR family transcriptional regulator
VPSQSAGQHRGPKYQYVANVLRGDIASGKYPRHTYLPAESKLIEMFRVSQPTIRSAIALLRSEGLLESRHGIGTLVVWGQRRQRYSRGRYGRARADQKLLTSDLEHDIIAAGRDVVPDHVAAALDVSPDTEMIVRQRLLSDPVTKQVEEMGASYLPLEIAEGTYLEEPVVVPKALFLCVEELSGKRYASAADVWEAGAPSTVEAVALNLPTGAAVVRVIHVARADDGTLLEVSESVWPASRVQIVDEYEIPADPDESQRKSDI